MSPSRVGEKPLESAVGERGEVAARELDDRPLVALAVVRDHASQNLGSERDPRVLGHVLGKGSEFELGFLLELSSSALVVQ